jgi:hypothetical protein
MSLPPLSSMGANRSLPGQSQSQNQTLPPLLPSRPLVPMSSVASYNRHNNVDSTSTTTSSKQQQPPPPPRLKSSISGDSLRDMANKEMPNFKGNFQNCSSNEVGHSAKKSAEIRCKIRVNGVGPSRVKIHRFNYVIDRDFCDR